MARKPTAPTTSVGWAMLWLERGYPVLPLFPRSKAPACTKGEHWEDHVIRGKVSEAELTRRFGGGENLGILTGQADSRGADVDLDCPEAIELGKTVMPPTGVTWGRASTGLTHYLYRALQHEPGFTRETYTEYALPGVRAALLLELRYTHHQTMAPGSLHPDTGEPILCGSTLPGEPAEISLDALRGYCRMIAGTIILKRVWPSKDSHRRDEFAMCALAGLIRAGVDADEAGSMIQAAASLAGDEESRKRGSTAKRAAERIAESKATKGFTSLEKDFNLPGFGQFLCVQMRLSYGTPPEGDNRLKPVTTTGGVQPQQQPQRAPSHVRLHIERPYVDLPPCLPPILNEIVYKGAEARNVDPVMILLPALASLGTLIGTSHKVTPNGDWWEFPIMWTCILSDTGTRKSAGFEIATSWMDEEQHRMHEAWVSAREADREALQVWKDSDGAERGPRPKPTAVARDIYVDDSTVEGLADVLSVNPRGTGYFAEEGQGFFSRLDQYSGNNVAYFLKMYDGRSWSRRRVSSQDPDRKRVHIRHAALNLALTIQPGIFQKFMTEDNMVSGMLARFWLAWPTPRLNEFQRWPDQVAATKDWQTLQAGLYALPFADGDKPQEVRLSPEAVDLWELWHNAHAHKVFNAVAGIVKGADAKLWGQALRLALIFHLVEAIHYGSSPTRMIGADTLHMALTLASWISEEHGRIYWHFLATDKVAAETLAERMLRWFRRHPAVSVITSRELFNALKDRSGTVTGESVKDALEVLTGAGYGASVTTTVDGGKTRVEFTVNRKRLSEMDDTEPEEA